MGVVLKVLALFDSIVIALRYSSLDDGELVTWSIGLMVITGSVFYLIRSNC